MTASTRRSRAGGVVVPNQPRWFHRLAALLIFAFIKAVCLTLRYRWTDASGFLNEKGGPAIYCVWHNRLGLSMKAYWEYARRRIKTPGMAAIVSASRDGGFLAAVLDCFNVEPVRGSSSRRGSQALLELTTWAQRGYDLAITPDGPRGPRYHVQEGVMTLAQLTGLPIIPFSYHARWKLQTKSWDRFQIPLPFSVCEMNFGKPVRVPRQASEAERELLRQHLEATLTQLSVD